MIILSQQLKIKSRILVAMKFKLIICKDMRSKSTGRVQGLNDSIFWWEEIKLYSIKSEVNRNNSILILYGVF
jgi:hypothetical protein